MSKQFWVKWISRHGRPSNPPDPRFPNGMDVDPGMRPACKVEFPYPWHQGELGLIAVQCLLCGNRTILTSVGRRDDPRSAMILCLTDAAEGSTKN